MPRPPRVKMMQKKQKSEWILRDEDQKLTTKTSAMVSSRLASPTSHDRSGVGTRGLDRHPISGLPAVVTPEAHRPRYACEKCGTLGDDDRSCVKCGHWELLDLHRASDRQFNAVLITQRLQRRHHLITGGGLISALAGVVLLLIGTVYVASPVLLIGLILTLGGATLAAGGPIDV